MEKQMICECKRYKVYQKWKVKIGDPIKVYSFGHLLKNRELFLAMDYLFVKWLDREQNLHFTSLQSLHLQKIM